MVCLNITDYGATISDSLQTNEIQNCIDDCFKKGGGEVVIPAGIYRTGGIRLRSNVTLHLLSGAILEGSDNCEDYSSYLNDNIEPIYQFNPITEREKRGSVYPYSKWNNGIIKIIDAENIKIIGDIGSYIDGVNCYDETGEENYRGPHAINIQNSKNIYLEGYTIRNSANWAHAIFNSHNITAKNIKVYGGHDGFDVRTCDNVLVENCDFYTGDDCIAGFDNINVKIINCNFKCACNAVRFGGTDVTIDSCKITPPANFGYRGLMDTKRKVIGKMPTSADRHQCLNFFNYYCDFRVEVRKMPENIVFKNCEISGVDRIMSIMYDRDQWCCNKPLKSLKFKNCTFKNIELPSIVYGGKDEKIIIEFENCQISAKESAENNSIGSFAYLKRLSFNNTKFHGFSKIIVDVESKGNIVSDTDIIENISQELIDSLNVKADYFSI